MPFIPPTFSLITAPCKNTSAESADGAQMRWHKEIQESEQRKGNAAEHQQQNFIKTSNKTNSSHKIQTGKNSKQMATENTH